MHYFDYKEGVMHAEDLDLTALAEQIGTPFYCYSQATLERHYKVFADAFKGREVLIAYAMKANSNQAVLRLLANQGAGMDVVSMGELRRALAAGVPGHKILFSGVAKTTDEMAAALDVDILCFNVESEPELIDLSKVAQSMDRQARVSLRINPDVDAQTHRKISTGKKEDKFGVPYEDARALYAKAAALPNLKPDGVDMHIGSQITRLQPFEEAFTLLRALVGDLRADGHEISHVDLGGGLGIPYGGGEEAPPHPVDYARAVKKVIDGLDCKLIFEPGRMIAGNAGILVSRVIYVKQGATRTHLIIDAGMNDLIRPTLYEAYHEIRPVMEPAKDAKLIAVDVVGPVCETGDYQAKDRHLPPMQAGDLICIMTAGAYGAVQAGTYNSRLLVPEILVNGDRFAIIRPRQSYEDLIGLDTVPNWLEK